MRKFVSWASVAAVMLGLGVLPVFAADEKPKLSPEEQFKKMDKDGDGKLTLEEFVGKRTGEKADKAKETFTKKDKDADGKLTLEEFLPKKKA
jgi:Ca2+-binding EF-hand superfamily protein